MRFFWLWGVIVSSSVFAAIIGPDDRVEWYQLRDARLRTMARATAMIVSHADGYLDSRGWTRKVLSHADFDNLCSDVRFREQPAPGNCTGFLVAPDLLATASHCAKDDASCDDARIVFDFALAGPKKMFRNRIARCRRVVARDKDSDWVLLQLDRKFLDRKPMRLNRQRTRVGSTVAVLGFPRGIPLKIAGNAFVQKENRIADEAIYFEAELDVFGGSSGSPVVNLATLQVEGILTVAFGELETVKENGRECRKLRHFVDNQEATFPWVTRIAPLARRLRSPRNR